MVLLIIAIAVGVTTGVVAIASYAIIKWKHLCCNERQFNPSVNMYDDQGEYFYIS